MPMDSSKMKALTKQYGAKKGKEIAYAMENKKKGMKKKDNKKK